MHAAGPTSPPQMDANAGMDKNETNETNAKVKWTSRHLPTLRMHRTSMQCSCVFSSEGQCSDTVCCDRSTASCDAAVAALPQLARGPSQLVGCW
eukprot:361775-Chlamydomonas_euryale.AAC.10